MISLTNLFFSILFGLVLTNVSVQAANFTNPLNSNRGADPCMRFLNGVYFLSSTQNVNIQIKRATTIAGLKSAQGVVVYSDTTPGRDFNFWAPEFWYLNGRWYIYYAVAGYRDDINHRMHVVQGPTDPNNPIGTYTYVGSLIPSNFNQWAVDGSILQVAGRMYMMFSGKTFESAWRQCTYIVPMSSPTALSGPAVQVSCPSFGWELAGAPVHEGQEAITINGVTKIVYSASHCSTDDYALGVLTLSGTNPLNATAWTKASQPVFGRNNAARVYGPGHHFMFQVGSNWYFAYHGKSAPGQGCGDLRTTRVQPFTISGNNPVFPAAVADGVAVTEPL